MDETTVAVKGVHLKKPRHHSVLSEHKESMCDK